MSSHKPPSSTPLIAASPLWTRAPKRDEQGRSYFDFMVLIPGLKRQSEVVTEGVVIKLRQCLAGFENQIVYVDLNTRLNLLWISTKPVPGLSRMIVDAIRREIPEARVVAGDFNPESLRDGPAQTLIGRIRKRVKISLRLGRTP